MLNVLRASVETLKGKLSRFLRKCLTQEQNKGTPYKALESCATLLYASLSFL